MFEFNNNTLVISGVIILAIIVSIKGEYNLALALGTGLLGYLAKNIPVGV